jgi:hypothetical protein
MFSSIYTICILNALQKSLVCRALVEAASPAVRLYLSVPTNQWFIKGCYLATPKSDLVEVAPPLQIDFLGMALGPAGSRNPFLQITN